MKSTVIIGDLGRILWRGATGAIESRAGGGGWGDFTDGIIRNVTDIVSLYQDVGGQDRIFTGDGDNIAIGGFDDDYIEGGSHRDILVRFNDSTWLKQMFGLPHSLRGFLKLLISDW